MKNSISISAILLITLWGCSQLPVDPTDPDSSGVKIDKVDWQEEIDGPVQPLMELTYEDGVLTVFRFSEYRSDLRVWDVSYNEFGEVSSLDKQILIPDQPEESYTYHYSEGSLDSVRYINADPEQYDRTFISEYSGTELVTFQEKVYRSTGELFVINEWRYTYESGNVTQVEEYVSEEGELIPRGGVNYTHAEVLNPYAGLQSLYPILHDYPGLLPFGTNHPASLQIIGLDDSVRGEGIFTTESNEDNYPTKDTLAYTQGADQYEYGFSFTYQE